MSRSPEAEAALAALIAQVPAPFPELASHPCRPEVFVDLGNEEEGWEEWNDSVEELRHVKRIDIWVIGGDTYVYSVLQDDGTWSVVRTEYEEEVRSLDDVVKCLLSAEEFDYDELHPALQPFVEHCTHEGLVLERMENRDAAAPIVHVHCRSCGRSGSTQILPSDIQW